HSFPTRRSSDLVAQVIDQVAPAYIEHGADRNKGAEAHHFTQAPIQNGGAKRAALADEAYIAGARDGGGEGRIEPRERAHHAQAVGTDDAYVAAARLQQGLALQFESGRTDLLEARRNHDGGLDAFLRALVDNTGHGGRRCHDHGQIHLLGYLRDMLVGLDAKYTRPLGIDRENRTAERVADQVPENG